MWYTKAEETLLFAEETSYVVNETYYAKNDCAVVKKCENDGFQRKRLSPKKKNVAPV